MNKPKLRFEDGSLTELNSYAYEEARKVQLRAYTARVRLRGKLDAAEDRTRTKLRIVAMWIGAIVLLLLVGIWLWHLLTPWDWLESPYLHSVATIIMVGLAWLGFNPANNNHDDL